MSIIDYSEIDLTGGVKYGSEDIGAAYYNGERLWPFKVDLLFSGGLDGEAYALDEVSAYTAEGVALAGESILTILGERTQPLALGTERITNSTFASATGWTIGTSWSISGGIAQCVNPSAQTDLSQNNIFETGKYYFVEVEVVSLFSTLGAGVPPAVQLGDGFYTTHKIKTFQIVTNKATSTPARIRAQASTGTFGIAKYSVKEILTSIPARNSNSAQRPLLGSAPISVRNLLVRTEEFENVFWTLTGATVTANNTESPFGDTTADKLVESATTGGHQLLRNYDLTNDLIVTHSVYAKEAERRYVVLGSNTTNNAGAYVTFDLREGVVGPTFGPNSSNIISSSMESVSGGWWRCIITLNTGTGAITPRFVVAISTSLTPTIFQSVTPVSYAGDGTSGIYIWGAQREINSSASNYQRISGSNINVTEFGVPSYPFVRFDLSDDALITALPTAISGDVLVAGKRGSFLTPVSLVSGSNFTLGALSSTQTHTGGELGILRAVGDVVGWMAFNKTLAVIEKTRLMRYLKRRGAKGFMTEGSGSNLITTNADFETDLTGWANNSNAGASVIWSAGTALFQTDGVATAILRRTITVTIGKSYRFSRTGNARCLIGTSSGFGISAYGTVPSFGSAVFTATNTNFVINFQTTTNGEYEDGVSLKEIRAEEDWL